MKLKITTALLLMFLSIHIFGQETTEAPKGKVTGKVFFNYHLDATEDAGQTSAFELTRTYLGYQYQFNDKFSGTVLVDAGKGSTGSDYTVFVKNAKLDYKADTWLTLSAGLFGLKQFSEQEKFWGYRYVYKSFDDEYGFGSSADLGAMAAFKISTMLKLDVLVVNGEGYKKVQDASGNTRFGANLVYTPSDAWMFKAYYDAMKGIDVEDPSKETTISNIALFAGYRLSDKFRLGAEYNLLKNGESYKDAADNKELQGYSFYSAYNFNDRWNVFARYDELSSNRIAGATTNWNYSDDGKTIITGVEFRPAKGVNTSVNYQHTNFDDALNNDASLIYFNLEFSF